MHSFNTVVDASDLQTLVSAAGKHLLVKLNLGRELNVNTMVLNMDNLCKETA